MLTGNSPLLEILEIERGAVPVFEIVTVLAVLQEPIRIDPIFSDGLESETAGAMPTPLTCMACGPPGTLSLMVIAPDRVPVADGVNATDIVHVAATANDCPQLCVTENSVVPTIEVNVSGTVPVLVSTTLCIPLVEPTS